MAYDQETVDDLISSLLANQKVDYKIGDKAVKHGQKITQALQAREALMKNPIADQKVMVFDADNINEFGTDSIDYA
jgi:hypothetical protein